MSEELMVVEAIDAEDVGTVRLKDFTKKEAREATERVKHTIGHVRELVLELYERRAHKALGYGDNFQQYAQDEFGQDWKPEVIRQWVMWARIEREVLVMTNKQSTSPSTIPAKTAPAAKTALTQKEAFQLARLPSPELRREAWKDVTELWDENTGSSSRSPKFVTDLTHCVNRLLKGLPKGAENGAETAPDSPSATEGSSDTPKAAEAQGKAPGGENGGVSATDTDDTDDDDDVPVGAIVDTRTGKAVKPEDLPAALTEAVVKALTKDAKDKWIRQLRLTVQLLNDGPESMAVHIRAGNAKALRAMADFVDP